MTAPHSRRLLEAVGPLANRSVVELACGSGEMSDAVADAVGPHGRLLAGDIAVGAVHSARARCAQRTNVTVARFDACQIPCADGSVEVVVAGMFLMMVEQPPAVLAEAHRVLGNGGTFGASVWGTAEDNPWLTLIGATLARLELYPRTSTGTRSGGPFALGNPDSLRHLFVDAGFINVDVERVDTMMRCADHHAYLDSVRLVLPSVASAIDGADDRQYGRLVDTLDMATRRFQLGGELRLPVSALVCIGTVG